MNFMDIAEKVSIADVAKRAQVSVATVSRVLSGKRPKHDQLETRVLQSAKELHYSRNPFASALRSQKSITVGLVIPTMENPFFAALAENIEHVVSREGYNLFICSSNNDPRIEKVKIDTLINQQVKGIAIVPCDKTKSRSTLVRAAAEIPVVQIDQRVDSVNLSWIGVDDDYAMQLLVSRLLECGYETAAFLGSALIDSSADDRFGMFTKHVADAGLVAKPEWILLGEHSIDWGCRAAKQLLDSGDLPRAVVCTSDLIALGAMNAFRDAGLSIPQDIAVSGFDDTPFAELITPRLTTIRQPTLRMASEAWHLLSNEEGAHTVPVHMSLTPDLIKRESL
jgi:LacI family transcriptional regulator